MKCENIRAEFMEAVLNAPESSPHVQEHLQACAACAEEFASLQQTMALLDEWKTPEPSPYFSSRLRARVREQAPARQLGWLAWLRKPMVATAAAGLLALGAGLLESGHWSRDANTLANNSNNQETHRMNTQSSAVTDLQYLDKNADLFAEFDALDGQTE